MSSPRDTHALADLVQRVDGAGRRDFASRIVRSIARLPLHEISEMMEAGARTPSEEDLSRTRTGSLFPPPLSALPDARPGDDRYALLAGAAASAYLLRTGEFGPLLTHPYGGWGAAIHSSPPCLAFRDHQLRLATITGDALMLARLGGDAGSLAYFGGRSGANFTVTETALSHATLTDEAGAHMHTLHGACQDAQFLGDAGRFMIAGGESLGRATLSERSAWHAKFKDRTGAGAELSMKAAWYCSTWPDALGDARVTGYALQFSGPADRTSR